MILQADPEPRAKYTAWPCRLAAEDSDNLSTIQNLEGDDKSGIVRRIIKLGIRSYWRHEENARAFDKLGLNAESVLPYLGGGRGQYGKGN